MVTLEGNIILENCDRA